MSNQIKKIRKYTIIAGFSIETGWAHAKVIASSAVVAAKAIVVAHDFIAWVEKRKYRSGWIWHHQTHDKTKKS